MKSRGWCNTHYEHWRLFGTPHAGRSLEERFWEKVDKNGPTHPRLGTSCWIWTGALYRKGYGHFRGRDKDAQAHRMSYELAVGIFWPLFCDLQIDHRCHNHACVNPEHLRAVTNKQNEENRRGASRNNRSSGVRGVTWDKSKNRWQAQIGHSGKRVFVGRFGTIAEAEAAVIAKRNELFTHNDLDRA